MSANSTAVLDRAASPRFDGPLPDAGQVSAVVDAAAVALTFSYDNNGNRTEVWDALNHRTTYVYESNSNRLQAVVNALGHRVTHYYDLAGRQTAVQDARGYRTSFGYDVLGRIVSETNALGNVTSYAYDVLGRETVRTDALGNPRTTVYDAAGQAVSVLYANGDRITYLYDPNGQTTTIVDWIGTTTMAYSARGELAGKTLPGSLRMTMLYDSVGNRTTLTEPDGYSYTFAYDELNRCTRLRDPNNNVFTAAYDAVGRRTTLLDSSGLTRTYEYDPTGRLTTQIDWNGANPIVTFVDGYDAVGNRTSRIKDGVTTTWVYDSAYRLTNQQKSGQAASFVYDDGGNLTVKHHEGSNPVTFCYDAGNRLTTSIQGASQLTTFSHDANGNLTSERCDALGTLLTWTYDNENRCLNELRPSGANHTYTYQSDGLRWSAHHGGSPHVNSYIWDGQDLINEYIDGGLNARLAVLDGEVLARRQGGTRYVFVPDPLGSVHHLLDSSLNKAATMVYWPYGELQSLTGVEWPMQFVGALGYYTGVTNRVYARTGWYRPDIGRCQTVDPNAGEGGHPRSLGFGYASRPPMRPGPASAVGSDQPFGCNIDLQPAGPRGVPRDCDENGPVDGRSKPLPGASTCLRRVCAAVKQMRRSVDAAANAMCPDGGGYVEAILGCNATQICFAKHHGDCKRDPSPDSPCFARDTGGIWRSACCNRCKQCVCSYYKTEKCALIWLWMRRAFEACQHGRMAPPLPDLDDPCVVRPHVPFPRGGGYDPTDCYCR